MITNMLYGGPFRDMRLLQEEVNRLAQSTAAPRASFPAINVYAHQDGIVISAELPGIQQDDLEITVHRDTVTLRGERQDQADDPGAYHRRERGKGSFVRTFGLPFQVDPDKVHAKLDDGILTLSLQRRLLSHRGLLRFGLSRDALTRMRFGLSWGPRACAPRLAFRRRVTCAQLHPVAQPGPVASVAQPGPAGPWRFASS